MIFVQKTHVNAPKRPFDYNMKSSVGIGLSKNYSDYSQLFPPLAGEQLKYIFKVKIFDFLDFFSQNRLRKNIFFCTSIHFWQVLMLKVSK